MARPWTAAALGALTGELIASTPDPALQDIVELARAALDAPIAMASVALARTVLFRAHAGLPPPLAAAGGIARELAICDLVARSGEVLAIPDTGADPRVHPRLIEAYGLRAYLGAPLVLDGVTVGALCVFDLQPRRFDAQDLAAAGRLAGAASARLAALRARMPPPRTPRITDARALHELGDQLHPILGALSHVRLALAETAVLRAHGATAADTLLDVSTDLRVAIDEGEAAARAQLDALRALAAASVEARHVVARDVLSAAATLARSHVRGLPAVEWGGAELDHHLDRHLTGSRPALVRVLTAALVGLARPPAARTGARIGVEGDALVVRLLAPGATPAWLAGFATALGALAGDGEGVAARAAPGSVEVALALAPGA